MKKGQEMHPDGPYAGPRRKLPANARLPKLSLAIQREIHRLDVEENLTLDQILERLEKPESEGGFGVGRHSSGALSSFLRAWRKWARESKYHNGLSQAARWRMARDEAILSLVKSDECDPEDFLEEIIRVIARRSVAEKRAIYDAIGELLEEQSA